MDPGGSRPHRGDCRRGGDSEVVVAVEVDGHSVDVLQRRADEIGDRLRRGDAERVHDCHLLCTRLDGGLVHPTVEVRLGAGRVDAEEGSPDPVLAREAHGVRDALEHLLPGDADRLELQVGDRRLDHRRLDTELDEELEVGRHRAREAPDLGRQAGAGDQLDCPPVLLGDARKARLDPLDAQSVEQPRDLELLLGREDDADGLLPVAQGRVVEADLPTDPETVVERPGPDQVGHWTTPSGNEESFSTPSDVTRKLSSTRSPPPPGQ